MPHGRPGRAGQSGRLITERQVSSTRLKPHPHVEPICTVLPEERVPASPEPVGEIFHGGDQQITA